MKLYALLPLLFINITPVKDTSPVFVCNSSNAKKYHYKSNCRGLSNCHYKILKTSLQEAKKDGKTLCEWEK